MSVEEVSQPKWLRFKEKVLQIQFQLQQQSQLMSMEEVLQPK
jgi:hypothetical protein